MKKRALACFVLSGWLLIIQSGCAPKRADFFAMDTFMTVEAYGTRAQAALSACEEETRRIETLLSVTSESGDIYRVNCAEGRQAQIGAETAAILNAALACSRETDGAFDPTVYPIVRCWGFYDAEKRVPDEREIASLLPLVGWENVEMQGDIVTLPAGGGIDLGGVAKGYAADRLASVLTENGVKSALLSLGGNVYALGRKPDGRPWRVGVQDPFDAGAVIGAVEVADLAVVTSGSYQRYFTQDGTLYHHILDPATGYPADSGLASVTVVCENAARADALSTALFVMGLERASAYWRASGDSFAAIFVSKDGTVTYTENTGFSPIAPGAAILSK